MYALNQIPGLRPVLAALLILTLVGCSDEGSSDDTNNTKSPSTSQAISGVFQGRMVDGTEVNGVTATIARDGHTVYAIRGKPNRTKTTQAFIGKTQGTSSPVSFSGFVLENSGRTPIAFKAKLKADILTATLAGDRTLRLRRLPRSDAGLSIAQLAGDYALVAPNNMIWHATISMNGAIMLQQITGSCSLQGQVAVPDTGVNVFTLKVSGGACSPFGAGLSAVGSVDSLPPSTELLRLDGHIGDQPVQLNLFATS